MQKLSMFFAVTVAGTLGFAGVAAADGSLPRTGGALPMAGFVVASLGVVTRRLLG